jgi:thiol-disulfide isomerase/thioredoxin
MPEPILMFALSVVLAVPHFTLRDTAGAVHRENEWSKARAIVIFFTTTDCPLSNSYVPEMNRIQKAYADRNVSFYAVQTDTTIPDAEVRKHAKEFAFAFPVLFDPQQILVRMAGATVTPEVAVLSAKGEVLYLGRIDNRIEDFDKRRTVTTEFDLKDALDAILAGRAVAQPRTTAIGCGINVVNTEAKP